MTSLILESSRRTRSVGVGTGTDGLIRDRIKIYIIVNTLADERQSKGLSASRSAHKWTEFQYMIPVIWVRSIQVSAPDRREIRKLSYKYIFRSEATGSPSTGCHMHLHSHSTRGMLLESHQRRLRPPEPSEGMFRLTSSSDRSWLYSDVS